MDGPSLNQIIDTDFYLIRPVFRSVVMFSFLLAVWILIIDCIKCEDKANVTSVDLFGHHVGFLLLDVTIFGRAGGAPPP